MTALGPHPTRPTSSSDLAFDLLEGLRAAWRKVDPAKSGDIAAGFARMTGGIDVEWLIEKLGPPAPEPPASGAAAIVRGMRASLVYYDFLLPGDYLPEPPTERGWFGRPRPMEITQEMIVWAGGVARARSLMDLAAAADILEEKETK